MMAERRRAEIERDALEILRGADPMPPRSAATAAPASWLVKDLEHIVRQALNGHVSPQHFRDACEEAWSIVMAEMIREVQEAWK